MTTSRPLSWLTQLANTSAPQSSWRGIVEPLSGATLVLEHKSLVCHLPLWPLDLTYRHAPQASWEASLNPCSWHSLLISGWTLLGIEILWGCSRSLENNIQRPYMSGDSVLSQSICIAHNCCKILPFNIIGEINPRGSNILFRSDSSVLLVNLLRVCILLVVNWKWSITGCHSSSRLMVSPSLTFNVLNGSSSLFPKCCNNGFEFEHHFLRGSLADSMLLLISPCSRQHPSSVSAPGMRSSM